MHSIFFQTRVGVDFRRRAKRPLNIPITFYVYLSRITHHSSPFSTSSLSVAVDFPPILLDSPRVLRRLGHRFVVLALLFLIGAHWHILQSVAWTTMLADNLRNTSLAEAVARTFDGKHPCCLCKQIARGKQAEHKSQFPSPLKKLEFLPATLQVTFTTPALHLPPIAYRSFLKSLSFPPPTPPPRTEPA